ncbi:patatin-like phospholipase family protein [Motilibacter rhizosphaerae]|nr:patatin-like phospholipase family protein [Motilibacter rhizosphaerae]
MAGDLQQGPRRAVVLGAGGVLGAAWMVGSLVALRDALGVEARDADLLVGTSAGSVLAALLAAGCSAEDLLASQRSAEGLLPLPGGRTVGFDHDTGTGGWLPARPSPPPASPALLRRGLRDRHVPPLATFWAAMPGGRGSLEPLRTALADACGPGWPRPGLALPALDFATGERRLFTAASGIPVADAVVASCTAPLWYAPAELGGRTYIDGGVASITSADLLAELPADRRVDEAYVLAPLASLVPDAPRDLASRLERRWRRRETRKVLEEVRAGASRGTRVVLLTPGPEDLAVMGANLMDPRRRSAVLETALRTTSRALARTSLGVAG